ncbi:hypothetical protein T03_10979 [Trichinella britovi]|uniref:Uncharacterized protein n=1 Tax=Trichinella britovi TaxID=45882 RepID=A0A0V1CER4_TRIBR|nr:hypothetical protein T03_10979 [Trichinella britovi]
MYTVVGHALISAWLCTVRMGHHVRTASGQPVTFCSTTIADAGKFELFSNQYLFTFYCSYCYIVSLVHTRTQNAPQAGKSIQNV